MLGLESLEVYNSIFNITEENNKFELYTDSFDESSFEELKDELEEILSISDTTPQHLQHEVIGPRIIEAYKELGSGDSSTDGYIIILMGYARSPFRVFECYLRKVVCLDEEDIQLILKQYNSNFVTYEITPAIYSNKDNSEAVYTMVDIERTLKIEKDDISMKTKLILSPLGSPFETLSFVKTSFFPTLLKFEAYWACKLTNAIHADSPGVYTSDKILNLGTIGKIHLKCDVIDGSIMSGSTQPILFSFVLDRPSGYKVFCEPENIRYKKQTNLF